MKYLLTLTLFTALFGCQTKEEPKPAATTGTYMFWTTCQNTKDILIYIEGQYRNKITAYYPTFSTAPACGSQNNVTLELPGGVYKWKAQTDEILFPKKWEGIITVINGSCNDNKLTCQ